MFTGNDLGNSVGNFLLAILAFGIAILAFGIAIGAVVAMAGGWILKHLSVAWH